MVFVWFLFGFHSPTHSLLSIFRHYYFFLTFKSHLIYKIHFDKVKGQISGHYSNAVLCIMRFVVVVVVVVIVVVISKEKQKLTRDI